MTLYESQDHRDRLSATEIMVNLSYPNIDFKGLPYYGVCFLISLLYLCYIYHLLSLFQFKPFVYTQQSEVRLGLATSTLAMLVWHEGSIQTGNQAAMANFRRQVYLWKMNELKLFLQHNFRANQSSVSVQLNKKGFLVVEGFLQNKKRSCTDFRLLGLYMKNENLGGG